MKMSKASISSVAYVKIFLHALKFTNSTVGGFLIGTTSNNQITITDVIPTNHEAPIGPLLEIAADTIDNIYEEPICIVGYYYGNDVVDSQNNSIPAYIQPIQNTIAKVNEKLSKPSILLEIVDKNIATDDLIVKSSTFQLTFEGNLHKVNQVINQLVGSSTQYNVFDFEDYLNSSAENPSDYQNKEIDKLLDKLLV